MQGLLTMVKLKSLITERVDFYEIATQLVKKAGLKSKVKFTNTGDNKADTMLMMIQFVSNQHQDLKIF